MSLVAGIVLLAVALFWFYNRDSAPVAAPFHEMTLAVGDGMLAGYQVSAETIPSGEGFVVTLAWSRLPKTPFPSLAINHIDRGVWSQLGGATPLPQPMPDHPEWILTNQRLQLRPGTPPDIYDLILQTRLVPDNQLPDKAPVPAIVLGQLQVTSATTPPQIAPAVPLHEMVDQVVWLGYTFLQREAVPGEDLSVVSFWQREGGDPPSRYVNLSLFNSQGELVQEWSRPFAAARYTPRQWQEGEVLQGEYFLRLAAQLPTDLYELRLGERPLGQITVTAPEHSYEAPPVDTTLDTSFGEQITLHGLTATTVEGGRQVALVWQVNEPIETTYWVEVSLWQEDVLVAQKASIPAVGARPTTGWLPGEYVVDRHILAGVSAGGTWHIALVDPQTGTYLATPSGDWVTVDLTP